MPRIARTVIPNCPHHITQRGNNRQDVFFLADDRRAYLDFLQQNCHAAGVAVLGYCLMSNHVHLLAVPPEEEALAQAVGRTHFLYTRYVNRLHGRSGHLWQNRFFSCPLDEPHAWTALRYVERNPVRARLVRRAWRYEWSSAAAHVGERTDGTGLLDLDAWASAWRPRRWRALLCDPEDEGFAPRFWRATQTGRPLATDSWLSKLERRLGRRLRARAPGRPHGSRDRKPRRRKGSGPKNR